MKFTVKSKLAVSKGYPVTDKSFSKANSAADVAEKRKYPKGYLELKKMMAKLNKKEILGHQTKTGRISVSAKVPARLRREVAYHEQVEHKAMRK